MLAKKIIKAGARIAPADVANADLDFKTLATSALEAAGT
jgi:hypothetical protein